MTDIARCTVRRHPPLLSADASELVDRRAESRGIAPFEVHSGEDSKPERRRPCTRAAAEVDELLAEGHPAGAVGRAFEATASA